MSSTSYYRLQHQVRKEYDLHSILASLKEHDSQEKRVQLVECLTQVALLVPMSDPDTVEHPEDAFQLLFAKEHGADLLCTFSDKEMLGNYAPLGLFCGTLDFDAITELFLESTAHYLVINPVSEVCLAFDRSQVLQLFKKDGSFALNKKPLKFIKSKEERYRLDDVLMNALQAQSTHLPATEVSTMLPLLEQALSSLMASDSYDSNRHIAEQLASAARQLLIHYPTIAPEYQPLVVGALRYFISDDDVTPDDIPYVGLDDDAQIMNYVLNIVGLGQYTISF